MFENIDRMHDFANAKYQHFSTIWTQYDNAAFAVGIAISLWLFYFHCITSFGISAHQAPSAFIFGFFLSPFASIAGRNVTGRGGLFLALGGGGPGGGLGRAGAGGQPARDRRRTSGTDRRQSGWTPSH